MKVRFLKTVCVHAGFLSLMAGAACATTVTNLYHTNRVFQTVSTVITGTPTLYQVYTLAGQLTNIVGPTNIVVDTNSTCAMEMEGVAWCQPSATKAWQDVAESYLTRTNFYPGKKFDNVGWVKGTRQAYGDWGAYLWVLQNQVAFQSSPTNIWVSPYGVTNYIATVLVGTIGDYPPMTNVVDVGPTNWNGDVPTNYLGSGVATDITCRADFTAYYQLLRVEIGADIDNDGIIGANDFGKQKEYFPGRILCVDGHGISSNTDYLAEIQLAIQPAMTNGTAKLEALTNAGCIKVWTTTNKTAEVALPQTYDLSVTNPPSSLFVDGIATGKVLLAWSYTAPGIACTDKVAMVIIPTISYAPGKAAHAFVWAPLLTTSNSNSGNNLGWADATEFENQIKDQGWPTVTWFQDTTGDRDADFGSCTLANYKGMTNCGIFTVTSHGEEGDHPAVYAAYSSAGFAAISNWCAGETGITVVPWYPIPGDPAWSNGCYVARVSSSWLTAKWKPGMDANRAIGIWSICFSAKANAGTGEAAVKECAGGRWRVGYELSTYEDEDVFVNRTFLSRLNGTTNTATKRTCGDAWGKTSGERDDYRWQRPIPPDDTGLFYRSVSMDGNDWTTLCPAPLADNAVFPESTTGNRKGWGCIILDTHISTANSANDALTRQNGCPTSGHRWFGNANGTYGLGFNFDKTGGVGTTMRAVADKCRNEGLGGGRELDGDRVKPSKDDRDWSF